VDLGDLRREYQAAGLDVGDVAADPLDQLRTWLALVEQHEDEPNAVVLATADAEGGPSARTVLLKGLDERGLVVFTNYESRKGREAAANPHACLLFSWVRFGRQISITGSIERISAAESDAYFATRPRGSQLGAWASPQSHVLPDRAALDDRYAALEAEHARRPIPRPPHWGGLRVVPEVVELWQGRPNRLHDRLRYRRDGDGWVIERLAP
jgi:pyridoxamine 5'-phosphate oxidase